MEEVTLDSLRAELYGPAPRTTKEWRWLFAGARDEVSRQYIADHGPWSLASFERLERAHKAHVEALMGSLANRDRGDYARCRQQIRVFSERGLSQREIAAVLRVPRIKVRRIIGGLR